MKIAVISDIHGNVEALESVMKDIEKESYDKVFVLGDYAMAGSEPQKVIDWFMCKQSNSDFVMIQGNTDAMIADYNDELYDLLKTKAPIMAEALKDDVKIISSEQKNFLKNLPEQVELEEDGVKILLVHGSPRRNNEDISPNLPMEQLEEIISGVDADVVLCGHTHLPCGYQTQSKKTVVNVGSVGRPFTTEPKACYLKLTITKGKCLFEHRFIEYNTSLASEKMLQRTFKGVEKLAAMLLNPTERHF